jgi:uncharacterized repeat protein (TIGR01451 family)
VEDSPNKVEREERKMNSLSKNLILLILFGFLIFFGFTQLSLALTVTLYGEILDDGGDPNLLVWFEWGTTTAYGNQTPPQTKFGTGVFSATISGLANCTTYHYRAVARHQNYNDTQYGPDQTFTTPCPSLSYPLPTVDLKANGSDGPITIPSGSSAILSWTSANATSCVASGAWSGTKGTSGSESTGPLTSGPKTYVLTCTGPGGSATDSVTIYLSQVLGAISPTIQKKVRNLSDGQINFFDSTEANPLEVLEFQIIINSGSGVNNLILRDTLPSGISLRANSLKIDGIPSSQNIISGISLGNLPANQTKTITFLADVGPASQFSFGQTNLTNTATISWNGNSLSDTAVIVVKKTAVAGIATAAPTGFEKIFSRPFFLFLTFSLILIWLFKLHFLIWGKWLDEIKNKYHQIRSQTLLKLKIAKIKLKIF